MASKFNFGSDVFVAPSLHADQTELIEECLAAQVLD
jgi:hypothetical protein